MTTKKISKTQKPKKFLAGGITGGAAYSTPTGASTTAPGKMSLQELRQTMSPIWQQGRSIREQFKAGDISKQEMRDRLAAHREMYAPQMEQFRTRRDAGLAAQGQDFVNQFNALRGQEKELAELRRDREAFQAAKEAGDRKGIRAFRNEYGNLKDFRAQQAAARSAYAPLRNAVLTKAGVFKEGGSVKTKPATKTSGSRGNGIAQRGKTKGTMR